MAFAALEAAFGRPPLLEAVRLARPPLYLVGGSVRDAWLGRPCKDFDLLVGEGALELARQLSGSFVPLDEERHIARVVFPDLTIDVCELGSASLEDDLRRRDFTVNALAYRVDTGELIDLVGGLDDLRAGRLRPCGPHSLREDPLRIMRAFRLSRDLQFPLEPPLLAEIAAGLGGLRRVAVERIRDELFLMLALGISPLLPSLQETGCLSLLFPRCRGVAVLEALERQPLEDWLGDHLEAPLAGGRRRFDLLKLAALHWETPPELDLALSRREEAYLARLTGPLPPDRYELYAALGEALPDYAALSRAAGVPESAEWLRDWHENSRLVNPPRFLDGHQLQQLGAQGPEVGRLMRELARAAALGVVDDRAQAECLARDLLAGWKKTER